MIVNGRTLLDAAPINNMARDKHRLYGVSYGMSEAGYDIRVKQDIVFKKGLFRRTVSVGAQKPVKGNFTLASTIEHFEMPNNLVGIVHDKSTHIRKGLIVGNTVIEPGWSGYLTLELFYHGNEDLIIKAGSGIAQVIFHTVINPVNYIGKYQNQPDKPVEAIYEK